VSQVKDCPYLSSMIVVCTQILATSVGAWRDLLWGLQCLLLSCWPGQWRSHWQVT